MPNLDPFSGTWNASKARHLLNRVSFGVTQQMVEESVFLGLSGTISKLFESRPLPNPPLKYTLDTEVFDPEVNYEETWIHAKTFPDIENNQERNRVVRFRKNSLYAWSYLQLQDAELSIREKLTLFWHNHFVATNNFPQREYNYMNTLRQHALGNFKQLVKEITVDVSMLIYLSGSQNTNIAPNENYSRELLELFTIGKGDALGNGDYTNYTEEDVVQMAKVLTGWRVRGAQHEDSTNSFFSNFFHTKGDKTLSHRFNNIVITENSDLEYSDLIDVIFEQEECSRFIIRQLYIWFVNSNITSDIETNIIEPLAKIIRDNNYEISQALQVLFASEHFFENTFCMIKSPLDLMLSATKSLGITAPKTSTKEEYEFALVFYLACEDLTQALFNHPDVAGWKAYYQEPLFYKSWINSFLLPKRLDYCRLIVTGGDLVIDNRKYAVPPLVPVLAVAASIEFAQDPNILINELANRMFNYSITEEQVNSLKEVLIPGLPDFEWTVEYGDYLNNPNDVALRLSVEKKLRDLISTMVQMSEFQIM